MRNGKGRENNNEVFGGNYPEIGRKEGRKEGADAAYLEARHARGDSDRGGGASAMMHLDPPPVSSSCPIPPTRAGANYKI